MSTNKNKFIRIISFSLLVLFLFQVGAQAATRSDVKQIIIQEAQNSRVPASLALAVAKVESDFLEDALSSAGARGVMQIMPKTARDEFGIERNELWNARLNVQLGIDYLERLYDLYGGRWDLALSHYNGGSLNKSGSKATPHSYTRKYVKNVLKWQQRYGEQAKIWKAVSNYGIQGEWAPARTKVGSRLNLPRNTSIAIVDKSMKNRELGRRVGGSYFNQRQIKKLFKGARFDLTYRCSEHGDFGNALVKFRVDGRIKVKANCVGNSLVDSFDEKSDGAWSMQGNKLCLAFNSEKLNAYSRSNLPNTVFTRDRKCWSIKKGRFGVVASDKSGFKDWRASLISHPKYESQEQLFANITDRKLISRGTRNSSGTPRSVVRKSGNKIGKIYEKAKGKVWQGNPGFMERLKRARISLDDFGSNRKWRKDRG